jgi:ribosomal protein S18 acetylase RimI-like enzyme
MAAGGEPWRIRPAGPDDLPFLREMTSHAARWRPEDRADRHAALDDDRVARYIEAWGRRGDLALICEERGRRVGAAWCRLFPADRPGFGFIDEHTPEIAIAVAPDRRGRGVGFALLTGLIREASSAGYPAICLSVETDNPSLRLYRRFGFEVVSESPGALTMRRRLDPPGRPPAQTY